MNPGLTRRFENLLHQWAGQWFPGSRQGELLRALQRSAERAGFGSDLNGFLNELETRPDERILNLVLNEILVNETYFFRDVGLWEGLEQEILPDILERQAKSRNLRIWSAGCSTGEEPYSLAMLLRALVPRIEDWTLHLLATDLSEKALERARMAVYGKRALRELDRKRWGACFQTTGSTVRLTDSIRQMVHFKRQNLSHEDFPDPLTNRMDLILCRNVLIYLDRDLVERVITRFGECLRPQGWLVLAPTEGPLDPPPSLLLTRLGNGTVLLRRLSSDASSAPAVPTLRTARAQTRRPSPLPLPPPVQTPILPAPAPRIAPLPPPPPAPDPTDLLAQARQAADRGELVSALTLITECVEADPISASGWLVLALVQEEMDLLQDALDSLRRALYLDPELAVGHLQMARVQGRCGDAGVMRSLANFHKSIEGVPSEALLPEGAGITVGEARHLAEILERTWSRMEALS